MRNERDIDDVHLREMLRSVSRTFAISIERLPAGPRDAVMLAYLLFRVSDCLEDNETLVAQRKAELLHLWADVIAGATPVNSLVTATAHLDGSDAEVHVLQQAEKLLDRLDALPPEVQAIIRGHVRDTSLGMARWQERGPVVDDEQDMDDYMFQVAGRVGYLLTDLFAFYWPVFAERRDELLPLARHFGLGLQTVNIIRGLRDDFKRGWVFVPRSFLEPVGLTRDTLLVPEHSHTALQVIDRLADKAETHLRQGLAYITSIPRRQHRVRLACMWPLLLAVKTLAASRGNINVILSEAKITRAEVMAIIRNTALMGWSNGWLRHYYNRMMSVPRLSLSPLSAAGGD